VAGAFANVRGVKLGTFLGEVQKPARYVGGEWNQVVKRAPVACRMALCFPDVYEVGMSHLGSRILYHIANQRADTACERAFLPWPDMAALLRERGSPLSTLETQTPLCELDVVGITLQHELNYPGVVSLLELGRIPLWAAERDERHPLVIGGGPCAAAPEPVAPFFDAFVVGDGEEALGEVIEVYVRWKEAGGEREELLRGLSEVPGVYVPALYEAGEGRPRPCESRSDSPTRGEGSDSPTGGSGPERIRRRVVPSLEEAPFPLRPIVPFVEIVHDRAQIEINRGCTHGCRFCQAGILYRPVRQRSLETLKHQARAILQSTGYEQISLASLSCTDYPHIVELVDAIVGEFGDEHVSVSLPSLRTDQFGVELAERVSQGRKSPVTLAPEAGSQRLRDVINKNVTEENLREAARAAFRAGWHNIKLYFMVGLPTETDEDVLAIAQTVREIERIGEEILGPRRGRLRIAVTVSGFVPKPHSVFAAEPQCSRAELERKHGLLRDALRSRWVQLKLSSPDQTALEGILARGDRRLAPVIAQVAREGQGLESWHEWFAVDRWQRALAAIGSSIDAEVAGPVSDLEEAPWAHIDPGVSLGFLQREAERAKAAQATRDCREGGCEACGLEDECDAAAGRPTSGAPPTGGPPPRRPSSDDQPFWRAVVTSAKEEAARFLSHLDVMRALQRAFRRAEWPVAYSQGFHERPRMTIARALAMGVTASNELCAVDLLQPVRPMDAAKALAREMPPGLPLVALSVEPRARKSAFEALARAVYQVELSAVDVEDLRCAVEEVLGRREITVTRATKSGERPVDIRPGVYAASVGQAHPGLELDLACSDTSLVKPEEFVRALNEWLVAQGRAAATIERIHRVRLLPDGA